MAWSDSAAAAGVGCLRGAPVSRCHAATHLVAPHHTHAYDLLPTHVTTSHAPHTHTTDWPGWREAHRTRQGLQSGHSGSPGVRGLHRGCVRVFVCEHAWLRCLTLPPHLPSCLVSLWCVLSPPVSRVFSRPFLRPAADTQTTCQTLRSWLRSALPRASWAQVGGCVWRGGAAGADWGFVLLQ